MTEITFVIMDGGRGDGIPGMATFTGVVAGGGNHPLTAMVDIGMPRKVVGAVTGITIVEGVGLGDGLANGAALQGDRGGSRGMATLTGPMQLGVGGIDGKCRRVAARGTGGQHDWR